MLLPREHPDLPLNAPGKENPDVLEIGDGMIEEWPCSRSLRGLASLALARHETRQPVAGACPAGSNGVGLAFLGSFVEPGSRDFRGGRAPNPEHSSDEPDLEAFGEFDPEAHSISVRFCKCALQGCVNVHATTQRGIRIKS